MKTRAYLLLLIPGIFFASSVLAEKEATSKELQFGSVAMDIPAVMHKRLTPLTEYLAGRLGRDVSLKLSPNMGAAIQSVASGNVDMAYLTPVAYLNAKKSGDVQLVAKTVTNGKGSFQLMIVVKDDSPIKTVEELKGKSFAFGDKKALLQRAAVVGAGVKLEEFSDYKFIGHYDNISRAVLVGDFDAGILKDTTAFKWQNKGLRILYSSPQLPPYNIAASKNVDEQTLEQLKAAFLDLNPENPEHLAIIKSLDKKYDGFAATSDAEYDVIRKLVAPFQK